MDIVLFPLLTIVGLSVTLPGLGALMLWRRMSFFSDALAHASLLGVTLSLCLKVHIALGVLLISVVFGTVAYLMQQQRMISIDTILSALSAVFFSLALTLASFFKISVSFDDVLFGDILATDSKTVLFSIALGLSWLIFYTISSKPLVLGSLSKDLAHVRFSKLFLHELGLLVFLAIAVALSIPVLGIILLPSLMILPAITARFISHSPLHMIAISTLVASAGSVSGFFLSYALDLPTAPLITLVSGTLVVVMYPFRKGRYG